MLTRLVCQVGVEDPLDERTTEDAGVRCIMHGEVAQLLIESGADVELANSLEGGRGGGDDTGPTIM